MKVRLKELGTIFTGNTPSKKVDEYWSNRDIKFIKPDVIKDELCVISSANEYISASAKNVSRIVPANSILVTCIGKIGRVGITEEEVSFNQQINAIVPNEAIIPKYLAYAIYANRKQLKAIANAPVVPIINKTQFSDFKISICESVEKQNKIVRTLDVISGIITHDKKKIEALDELIKARFVEMFSCDKSNIRKLSELTETITKGTTPTTAGFSFEDDGINFFKIESITDDHRVNLQKVAHVNEECHSTFKRSQLKEGDVLFSIAGAIGRTAIIHDKDLPGNTNQALAIIRLKANSNVSRKYLISALESPEVVEQYRKKKRGVAQMNLSLQDIGNISIPVPNSTKQSEFEKFAKQVDKSKFAVQKSLEKTQLLFDSLMQEYFG